MKRWILFTITLLLLASCGRASPEPTPVVTAPPSQAESAARTGTVSASGEVVPAQQASLSFDTAGRVQSITVNRGETVESGAVLVALDTSMLEANVASAEAALVVAQAQLALLRSGPRPQDVAAAEAQLEAAKARVSEAAARRDRPDLGASEAEVASAQAEVAATMAEHRLADHQHDQTMTCVEVTLPDGETKEVCPALGTYEEQARYRMQAASASQTAAQAQLDALLSGADAEVRAARAGVWAAAAQRDAAQAKVALVQAGVITEELQVAEAKIVQAEAALQAARVALEQATLRAPFGGTVAAVDISIGETVMPAQAVLILADLERLQVETTDLSELDVGRVAMGQAATVYVEPLDTKIAGEVTHIAAQATTVGGDMMYTVVIALNEQPAGLRWGMSVEVEITP